MKTVKDTMLELARELPPESTWDDVMQRIYVRQKIEAGLQDVEDNRLVPHEVVFAEFSDDPDPVD